jgi:hypothetical protein
MGEPIFDIHYSWNRLIVGPDCKSAALNGRIGWTRRGDPARRRTLDKVRRRDDADRKHGEF